MAEATEDQALANGTTNGDVASGGGDAEMSAPAQNGLSNGDVGDGEVAVKIEGGEKKSSSSHSSSHKSSSKDKDRHSSSKHSSSSSKHHSSSSSSKDKDRHRSSSKHGSSSSSSKHHSSSSSSKDKDGKDKDGKDKHHSSSSSSKDKDGKDKHHSSSSSSRDKDKSGSSSGKHHSSSSSSKHHSSSSSSKDKEKDKHHSSSSSSKDKDKHHSSSSSKDKDKHHSSSSYKDKDKHRSSSSHGSSSKHSSSSSKHHSSSSKDKDKHSSSSKDKDKDRHSSSKHSSSSSRKDKDKESKEVVADGAPDLANVGTDSGDDFKSPTVSRSRRGGDAPTDYAEIEEEEDDPLAALEAMYENEKKERKQKEAEVNGEVKMEDSQAEDSQEEEVKVEDVKEEDMEEDVNVKEEAEDEYLPEQDDDDEVPLASRSKYKDDSEEEEEYEPETKPRKGRKKADSEEDDWIEPETKKKKVKKEKVKKEVKHEAGSDDDLPLSARVADEEDEKPLSARAPVKKEKKTAKRKAGVEDGPAKKKVKNNSGSPTKANKKVQAEVEEKWKWWEEERKDDGTKWEFLEHKGPMFAPAYVRIPKHVQFLYDGKHMELSQDTEEVATFYGRMLDHDYTSMEVFNKNFMKDWRSVMTERESSKITDLTKCNFKQIMTYFKEQSEIRKNRSKEEKKAEKEANAAIVEEYGFCTIDGHKEKIGNFRLEPPGLFRGRGAHPKMGCLKKRLIAQQITINVSKDAEAPDPPPGERWKEVRHDNTVSWLASWIENVQGQGKYIMLNPASRLKGEKDWQKYEKARDLHKCVDKIRANYYDDFKSKEMRIRQRSVAMYFIDKLALRAGNEKDEDSADTVGCCSLRWEHIKLHPEMDGKQYVVEFDFLGKDSIRYYNKVAVEKRVFKNLDLFMEGKGEGDDLFDRLNTSVLNKHLSSLMDGLTAKVFRTYNASKTLQEQLDLLTNEEDPEPAKMLSYNRANRKVAILCNHQKSASKNFDEQMGKLQVKIEEKREKVKESKAAVKQAKQDFKGEKTEKNKKSYEHKKKMMERMELQLHKLEVSATDKDENKLISLGTSKLNYLDPRISVAWCKKWEVPIEKVYTKTHRDKFAWAIDMTEEDFVF